MHFISINALTFWLAKISSLSEPNPAIPRGIAGAYLGYLALFGSMFGTFGMFL